jgi:tetratricopeptide (TPR) repeat protein
MTTPNAELLYDMLANEPTNDMLYYYMACVHAKHPNSALFWHKLCFDLNPTNVENILDYMKIYNDTHKIDEITKFNEQNGGILNKVAEKDNRVKLLLATYETKRKYNCEAIRLFLEIINDPRSDKITLSHCYSNLGFAYVAVGEHDKAIEAYEKSDTTNRIALDNLLMAYDYRYAAGNKKSIAKNQIYATGATYGSPSRPPSLAGNLRSRGVAGGTAVPLLRTLKTTVPTNSQMCWDCQGRRRISNSAPP